MTYTSEETERQSLDGNAWVFGDDINTDVIHPPAYFSLNPEKVKEGLFKGFNPSMQKNLQPNDILIGGKNFGCGSSRETSIWSLKLNQIGVIIAVDFARIFLRNATNNGLPCVTFQHAEDHHKITQGDRLSVSFETWNVTIEGQPGKIPLEPVGSFIQKIWRAGGLLSLLPS